MDLILTGGRGPSTQTNLSFVVSYSTDGGTNWTRCNLSGSTSGFCYSLAVAPSQTQIVYAGGEVGGSGAVYRSTDSGLNWTRTPGSPAETVFGLAVHPFDPNRVFAATSGGVYLTTNGGVDWNLLREERGLRAVRVYPFSADTVIVGGDFGVLISEDGGNSWDEMNQGLGCTKVTALEFAREDELRLIAGTNGAACYAWVFPTGVSELKEKGLRVLHIAPNPATGQVRVSTGKDFGRVALFDALGRRVWQGMSSGNEMVVDVRGLTPGCYQVEFVANGQRKYQRLIISR
ncbi:MAG: T9SS type A sorting domain-containing protein [candidate division WOR-3 bacterium]